MKIEEFMRVQPGDKLYVRGNCTHRGMCGTVVEVRYRIAIMSFDEDGLDRYGYSYYVLSKEPVVENRDTYDYIGRITENNRRRNDDLVFTKETFAECDGRKVPLVWDDMIYDPCGVLGTATLENRVDGVYAKLIFNGQTELVEEAKKMLIETGKCDISFSANKVKDTVFKYYWLVNSGVIRAIHITPKEKCYKYKEYVGDARAEYIKHLEEEIREDALEKLRAEAEALGYVLVRKEAVCE